jgi:hypothetical protein
MGPAPEGPAAAGWRHASLCGGQPGSPAGEGTPAGAAVRRLRRPSRGTPANAAASCVRRPGEVRRLVLVSRVGDSRGALPVDLLVQTARTLSLGASLTFGKAVTFGFASRVAGVAASSRLRPYLLVRRDVVASRGSAAGEGGEELGEDGVGGAAAGGLARPDGREDDAQGDDEGGQGEQRYQEGVAGESGCFDVQRSSLRGRSGHRDRTWLLEPSELLLSVRSDEVRTAGPFTLAVCQFGPGPVGRAPGQPGSR